MTEILEFDVPRADRLMAEARAHRRAGRVDRACRCVRLALRLAPTAGAHRFLARALVECGRLEEAARACREAIALAPEGPAAYRELGACLIELGRLDEAEEWLYEAVARTSGRDLALACFDLGRVGLRRGEANRAVTWFRRSLAHDAGLLPARRCLAALTRRSGPGAET